MSGEYTYYCDGFFGFGPPGTFHAYSLMHLAPLLVCAGLVVLVWFGRDWLRNWKGEAGFRYALSFLMFSMEFSYFLWLLYVGDSSGNYLMMSKLPLHACDLGLIVCMFMVTSKSQTLFGINFFVTLFGAMLACIIPQTVLDGVNPSYYRYYQYFGEHLLPVFATSYMIIVHRMQPRYRDIWISVGAITAMVPASIMFNDAFPGSDYLFLKLDTTLFPTDQYLRATVFSIALITVFHLMWLAWSRVIARSSVRGK